VLSVNLVDIANLPQLVLDPQVSKRSGISLLAGAGDTACLYEQGSEEPRIILVSTCDTMEFCSKEVMTVLQSSRMIDVTALEWTTDRIVHVNVALGTVHLTS
jgi:hypothetical protein